MASDKKTMAPDMLEKLRYMGEEYLLRSNPNITPVRVSYKTCVRAKLDERSTFFYHPMFGNPEVTEWPRTTDCACLHCTECFTNEPYPATRGYDDVRNIYYVFGVFCSLNCAKAFLLESEPSLSTLRLLYFTQMCFNVYKVYTPIKPAPPRIRLKKFGGDLTIEEFRADFVCTVTCTMREPPFVPSPLAFENYTHVEQDSPLDIIDKTQQKTLFDKFLEEKALQAQQKPAPQTEEPAPAAKPAPRAKKPAAPRVRPAKPIQTAIKKMAAGPARPFV